VQGLACSPLGRETVIACKTSGAISGRQKYICSLILEMLNEAHNWRKGLEMTSRMGRQADWTSRNGSFALLHLLLVYGRLISILHFLLLLMRLGTWFTMSR
jgi:hypothetical protein